MSDEQEVPLSIINGISRVLDENSVAAPKRELREEETITTLRGIKQALKENSISGTAIIEWVDNEGPLRVNVIDFISEDKIKAMDPRTGQQLIVKRGTIPDGTWRLLV